MADVRMALIRDAAIPAKDRAPLVGAIRDLSTLENLIEGAPDLEIRVAAVRTLPAVKLKGYISVAIRALENTRNDREVRLEALGVLGSITAFKNVRTAIARAAEGDPDAAVKQAAGELLRVEPPEKEKE